MARAIDNNHVVEHRLRSRGWTAALVGCASVFLAPSVFLALGILLPAGGANAQLGSSKSRNDPTPLRSTYGDEVTDWRENELALPPFPRQEHLTPIQLNFAGATHRYYIDESSLSFGSDKVIRYTVVIRSKTGVVNVFYEGISCPTREFKEYAYGTAKREFRLRPAPRWRAITRRGVKAYRDALFTKYVCSKSTGAIGVEGVIKRLRHGGQIMHSSWDDARPDA